MNKTIIYQELIQKQRKNLVGDRKLSVQDLNRIASYLPDSIFTNKCSLWQGYITEINNNSFVNFFFNGKKQALHRILFYNFINDVNSNEYLKFTCENKGKCCSVNHIVLSKTIEDKPVVVEEKKEIFKVEKKDITVNF